MRQDYCPIGGAPCQSMCDEPCLSTAKKRIAELEKDAEILQTNLDAALMQVKQLREALHHIGLPKSKIVYCRDGHEEAVLTARKVLEETK